MKIKEQTRKLAAGCSKHCFEVADRTDEVSSKHRFEVADRTDEVSSKHRFEVADRTDEVSSKHRFEVADRTDEVSSKHCFEVVDKTDEVSHIYTARRRWRGLKRFSLSIRKNQSPKGADYEVIVYRHP